MFKPFDRGAKTAPSSYPRVPFHLFRCFQLISSIIVGGIMAYFTYHLRHDNYKEPWTFIWLFSASLASIAALTVTICLHCLLGLNPRLNIGINAFLAAIWALSFGLLTWYMTDTLGDACDTEHWHEDVGIMVCRIYKALWTFTLVGLGATLAALFLDIYVHRKQTSRGMYKLPDLDAKRPGATHGPYTETPNNYGYGGLSAPRESEVWEEPRRSTGPYSEQADTLINENARDISDDAVFGRYDTGYQGAGATVLR
ncbi:uncharacterized protein LTR77_007690 [Saxophila tyrrhenica]|uniref:MARVEL domain-containing protein n=1 Tax=Saxophila tyrrhenica TaxID=1690608 RepID=A0AAV9P2R7_9PEZI|nr:hypothetical protein LTR77_007690 [Saxophila tyrrhenica]